MSDNVSPSILNALNKTIEIKKEQMASTEETVMAPTPTPVVETPAETTIAVEAPVVTDPVETVVENQPVNKTVEVQPQNDWFALEENTPVQTIKPTESEPVKNDYSALLEDPEVKQFLELKKAGKSLPEIAQEYQPIDFRSKSADDIVALYGKENGWSETDIESQLTSMEGRSKFEIDTIRQQMQKALEKTQEDKFNVLVAGSKRQAELQAQLMQRATQELAAEKQNLVGKEIVGLKLTPDDANDFEKFVNEFNVTRADGSFNIPLLRNFWLGARKLQAIQKSALSTGKTEGIKEVLSEVHRPSENPASASRIPTEAKPVSPEEKAKALADHLAKTRSRPSSAPVGPLPASPAPRP
jgi:hypothetical protein